MKKWLGLLIVSMMVLLGACSEYDSGYHTHVVHHYVVHHSTVHVVHHIVHHNTVHVVHHVTVKRSYSRHH